MALECMLLMFSVTEKEWTIVFFSTISVLDLTSQFVYVNFGFFWIFSCARYVQNLLGLECMSLMSSVMEKETTMFVWVWLLRILLNLFLRKIFSKSNFEWIIQLFSSNSTIGGHALWKDLDSHIMFFGVGGKRIDFGTSFGTQILAPAC